MPIAAGVWHHPLLVLHEIHDFLLDDRSAPDENLEAVHFDADTAPELALPDPVTRGGGSP